MQRAHDTEIGEAVERDEPADLERFLQIHDRLTVRATVAPVDAGDALVDLGRDLAVARHLLTRRDADLHEHQSLTQPGGRGEQPVDRVQAFGDALRVIETVHAHSDDRAGLEPQLALEARRVGGQRRIDRDGDDAVVVDADRRGDDAGDVIGEGDRAVIDARVGFVADALEKIPPVAFELEREQVVRQQSGKDLPPPRAHPQPVGMRPRDVPEERALRVRPTPAQIERHERQMVVLDEDRRTRVGQLRRNRVGEASVHQPVLGPVLRAKDRPHVDGMAHRPEPLVGESAVVAPLFFGRQPDALERVGRLVGRNPHPVARVDDQTVRVAGAVRDPRASTLPQQRVESNRDAAGGRCPADRAVRLARVHVRFAVGHDEQSRPGHSLNKRQGLCQLKDRLARAPSVRYAPRMSTPEVSPKGTRETRLLLVTIAVSVGVLLLLARYRFPDDSAIRTVESAPAPLERLAARAAYDELASIMADLERRIAPRVAIIRTQAPAGGTSMQIAPRLLPDRVVTVVPAGAAILGAGAGSEQELISRDLSAGLAVLRVHAVDDSAVQIRQLPLRIGPRYAAIVEATAIGPAITPLYIGRAETFEDPHTGATLLSLAGVQRPVHVGAAIFTLEGLLVGLVRDAADTVTVVPAETLQTIAVKAQPAAPARGDLGVEVDTLNASLARATGADRGVVVSYVRPEGPAAEALRIGDVIQSIDGKPVSLFKPPTQPTSFTFEIVRNKEKLVVIVPTKKK